MAVLREYLADVIASCRGRPATGAEVDAEFGDGDPVPAPPGGIFLVGAVDGIEAGCAGVLIAEPGVAELRRVHVRPALRGTGGGAALVRLDTRSDLVASRALHARLGNHEVPAFDDDPHTHHCRERSSDEHIRIPQWNVTAMS